MTGSGGGVEVLVGNGVFVGAGVLVGIGCPSALEYQLERVPVSLLPAPGSQMVLM
jgi:hypothetical protein